jgi:DNA-nicking Smr family endonuclease
VRTVAPLRAEKPVKELVEEEKALPRQPAPSPGIVAVVPRPAKAPPAPPPSLAPLDRRTRSKVSRGIVAIDARVDLHGLTQAAAHRRLAAFLADTQAQGARLVLVITGKGGGIASSGEERGVLRRMVPIWLAAPDLRPLVVGFETAGRSHGGEGALYVRIRRGRAL